MFWIIDGPSYIIKRLSSSSKSIVAITRRKHCFHDSIHFTPILLLWDLSNVNFVYHLWRFMLCYLLIFFSMLWFIGCSNILMYGMCLHQRVAAKPAELKQRWHNDFKVTYILHPSLSMRIKNSVYCESLITIYIGRLA